MKCDEHPNDIKWPRTGSHGFSGRLTWLPHASQDLFFQMVPLIWLVSLYYYVLLFFAVESRGADSSGSFSKNFLGSTASTALKLWMLCGCADALGFGPWDGVDRSRRHWVQTQYHPATIREDLVPWDPLYCWSQMEQTSRILKIYSVRLEWFIECLELILYAWFVCCLHI